MRTYDLIIRNGTLIKANGIQQADLAIAEGKIVAIDPYLPDSASDEIDASGLRVFPGVIDANVHFNEPGNSNWEGFASGSRALAAGGSTTFFDMPLNAYPPTLDATSFAEKRAAGEASSYVDFALWGGLIPGNLDRMEELAECGVVGYKTFMCNSGIDAFPAVDDYTLYRGMEYAAQLGKIVAIHAENDLVTAGLAKDALAQGRDGVRDYLASRPVVTELEATARAILFAQQTGCSLHFVHVSIGRGVSMVADARAQGLDISCETCPHYLVLTEEDVEKIGALAKCAPPLRSRKEQDALWLHIFAGTLPMVTSDHSPAPPQMKRATNFFDVWGGISGCQSLLQLLLTEGYHRRYLSQSTIASISSEYVARRFRVFPHKGSLQIGADADLVLVSLNDSSILTAEDLFYRYPQSPYVGRTMRGQIVRTIVRGITIFLDGQIVAEPAGRFLQIPLSPLNQADRWA